VDEPRTQRPEPLSDQIEVGGDALLVRGADGKFRTFFRVETYNKKLGRVYFLRDGDRIKIGTMASRVKGGQSMNPRELVLIGSVPGDRQLEVGLHRKFRHLHVRGEWFEATPELLTFINELLADTK
jgi:hypothetical protein